MGKTMSVLSEIKVVVAAVMLLVLWPCSRLVYVSCQMEVQHQCSLLKILLAALNILKVVKGVGIEYLFVLCANPPADNL